MCVSDLLCANILNGDDFAATGKLPKTAPEALAEALRHKSVDDWIEAAVKKIKNLLDMQLPARTQILRSISYLCQQRNFRYWR